MEYGGVPPACCGTVRRFCFGGLQLVATLGIGLPVAVAAATSAVEWLLRSPWHAQRGWPVLAGLLLVDTVAFFGGLLALIVASLTLPRLLNRALRPGQVYPLYGIHHGIQRVIARMTNIGVVMYLFGDSSSIAHYLRWLGYRMPQLEQSGSNFGVETKHESPYLCTVGRGPWSPTVFH